MKNISYHVKYLRQIVTAVSDGATAAVAAERYIEEIDYQVKSYFEIVLNLGKLCGIIFFKRGACDAG